MPQAKLPDINNAWVRYRNYGLQCIHERNYTGAIAAVNEINALFPDEYRVEINTEKYNQSIHDTITVVCEQCKKEINYIDIHLFELILPTIDSIIIDKTTDVVWVCTECNHTNRRETTEMKRHEQKKPHYNKLIPEPPVRIDGIQGRTEYHNSMVKWFYDALEELDHQLGKYREEYTPTDSEEGTDYEGDEDAD